MARSLNRIELIGNLTRDPELRYTPAGRPVCDIGLATNRSWRTEAGETQEETSYHRLVAWGKLAEQCGQLLVKGRKIFVSGRLAYHTYQKDDEEREVAQIVIDDMLLLDAKPTRTPQELGAPDHSALTPPGEERSSDSQSTSTDAEQAPHDEKRHFTDDEIADAIPF